jgi:hypothetical protein
MPRSKAKAMLFKDTGRNEYVVHGEFKRLPDDINVPEAMALLVK